MNNGIVVGVDGSDSSVNALRKARELAQAAGVPLWVVHVRHFAAAWSPDLGADVRLDHVYEEMERRARARTEEALSSFDSSWTFEVRAGDPSEELERAAEEHEADLIVVGSHGFSAPKRWVLGSISTRLIHHSKHSVLVAR